MSDDLKNLDASTVDALRLSLVAGVGPHGFASAMTHVNTFAYTQNGTTAITGKRRQTRADGPVLECYLSP